MLTILIFHDIFLRDLERSASTILAIPEIKVVSIQKTEHQFVLDVSFLQTKYLFWTIYKISVFLTFKDYHAAKFQICYLAFRLEYWEISSETSR